MQSGIYRDDNSYSKVVMECVRFILCREGSKKPIKQSCIKDHLSSRIPRDRKLDDVIQQANEYLIKVYGFKIIKIDANEKQYIVIRNERCDNSVISTYINEHERKILIATLTHIFMSGKSIKQDEIVQFLGEADIVNINDTYEKTRLIKTLLKFTKQLYLKSTKARENNEVIMLEWGQRAREEIPQMFLLEKVAEAYQAKPEDWPDQFKRASRVEAQDNQDEDVEML